FSPRPATSRSNSSGRATTAASPRSPTTPPPRGRPRSPRSARGSRAPRSPPNSWESEPVPHIDLGNDLPGIRSLLIYQPETGKQIVEMAETLLRAPNSLERWERELIATHVSELNECQFCATSHAAFTAAQLPGGLDL